MAERAMTASTEAASTTTIGLRAQSRFRLPRWEVVTLGVWFVVFGALAEYFPRTGDDWAWGTQEGLDRLQHFFEGVNGRYAGDLVVLALVRSGPVTALVVSAIVCATLFLVLQIASNRTPVGYAMVSALFLAIPRGTWREGVVWLSGFANYAVAALVFLCFLSLAQAEWHGRLRRPGIARLALIAGAGFVGQLFMEHVTLCICAMGLGLSVLYRRRCGRWGAYTTTWTVAAFVGAAVMFTNSAYRRAAAGGAGYQQVQVTSGPHALRNLAVKLLDYLPTQSVVTNIALNAVLAILLVLLAVARGRGLRTRSGTAVLLLSMGYLLFAYGLLIAERGGRHVPEHLRALATVAAGLLLLALVVSALTLIESPQRRWTLLAVCASLVLMVGPLLLVNPIGSRCFYPTYLLLVVVVSVIGREVQDRLPALRRRVISVPLHLVSVGLIAAMFVVYVTMNHAIDQRLDKIRDAVHAGQTKVLISPLPYPYYVHNGDPFYSVLERRFKAYYGIPAEFVVKLSPNPWLHIKGKPKPHVP